MKNDINIRLEVTDGLEARFTEAVLTVYQKRAQREGTTFHKILERDFFNDEKK